jgi:hypothetical protein
MSNPDESIDWEETTRIEADIPTETYVPDNKLTSEMVSANTQMVCKKHRGKSYMKDGTCPMCSGLV